MSSSSSSISASNPAGRLVLDGQTFSDRVVDSVAIRLSRNIDCGNELVKRWRDEIKELRDENQYALGYLSTLQRCSCAPPKKLTRKYTLRNPSHQTRLKDRAEVIEPVLDIGDDCLGLSTGNVIIPPKSNPVFQKYTVIGAVDVSEARNTTPLELHSKVGTGMIKKQQSPSSSSSSSYVLPGTPDRQGVGMSSPSEGTSSNHPRTTSLGTINEDDDEAGEVEDGDSSPLGGVDDGKPPKSKMVVYGYTSLRERSRICDWGKRGGMAKCHPYYGFIHLCGSSIEWFFPKGDVTLIGFFREGKKEVAIT